MKAVGYSVRPPLSPSRDGGGPSAKVEMEVSSASSHPGGVDVAQAMFPVGEAVGVEDDELRCEPCEEEEQAEVPANLPTMYQPTHSEYLDHCVTHYPYRAWCKHCLE